MIHISFTAEEVLSSCSEEEVSDLLNEIADKIESGDLDPGVFTIPDSKLQILRRAFS